MINFLLNTYYNLYYKVSDHIHGTDNFNLIISSKKMHFLIPTRTAAQVATVLLWASELREISLDSTLDDLKFTWALRKDTYIEQVYTALEKLMREAE